MGTITLRGTDTSYGTPDEATLGFGVEAVSPPAGERLAELAGRTSVLVTLCYEGGVGEG